MCTHAYRVRTRTMIMQVVFKLTAASKLVVLVVCGQRTEHLDVADGVDDLDHVLLASSVVPVGPCNRRVVLLHPHMT